MHTSLLFAASEGGLFDIDATLPLMAAQVVILTYLLNYLFFKPVGKVVEDRENFVNLNRLEAKKKLVEVEKLTNDLEKQLKEARVKASKVVSEAEQESDQLYQEAVALALGEANSALEKTRAELSEQKNAAEQQLKKDVANLSELIINRLISAK
tara:strand:- start:23165 stop:23626 length:462 start_codon:yes stop_codon:yes gene_type:complete